jgi:hypothetical protein
VLTWIAAPMRDLAVISRNDTDAVLWVRDPRARCSDRATRLILSRSARAGCCELTTGRQSRATSPEIVASGPTPHPDVGGSAEIKP